MSRPRGWPVAGRFQGGRDLGGSCAGLGSRAGWSEGERVAWGRVRRLERAACENRGACSGLFVGRRLIEIERLVEVRRGRAGLGARRGERRGARRELEAFEDGRLVRIEAVFVGDRGKFRLSSDSVEIEDSCVQVGR